MLTLGRMPARPLSRLVTPRFERWAPALLLLLLVVFYLGFASTTYADARGLYDGFGVLIGRDFIVHWSAAVLTLDGQASSLFDLDLFRQFQVEAVGPLVLDPQSLSAAGEVPEAGAVPTYPWLYPPLALFYVLPLGLLSYLWAYAVWCAVTLAFYLAAACAGRWRWTEALALVLAPATVVNVFVGQNGFLTAALLVGGLRLLDRRPVLAGVLFGLLCFKPQIAVLVPVVLVAARLWRPLASAGATAFVLAGLSLAAFGLESWIEFFARTTGYQAQMINAHAGYFLNIVVAPYGSGHLLGLDMPARALVQACFTLAAALGVYWAFRGPGDRKLQLVVLLAGVFLASPYGYHYDLPLVSVAALWAYQHAARTMFLPGERLLLVLVWILPLVVVVTNPLGVPLGPVILTLFFALALARVHAGRARLPGQGVIPRPGSPAVPRGR